MHPGGDFINAGTPQVSPASLAFDGVGSSNARTVAVSQAGYGGAFAASSATCSGVATISPSTGRSFSVTPVGAGRCTFVFTGEDGSEVTLDVGVTTTAVSGS